MKAVYYSVILLLFSAGTALAQTFGDGGDSVLASVGNLNITADEFVNGYNFGPAFYKRQVNSKKIYLDNLIREKMLALDARERRLDTTGEVREYYNAFRDDIATEELFRQEILRKINITQAEIDTVAKQKLIDVEVEWLYSPSKEGIIALQDSLKNGVSFSKLFQSQFNDSVSIPDRSMKTTRFQIQMKNPQLGKIIDGIEAGQTSLPVRTNDGWYLVLLKDFSYNPVPSESEVIKLTDESRRAVMKMKMDAMSDDYVKKLMTGSDPVIKRNAFRILRSYLAGFDLTKEKYLAWKLDTLREEALKDYEEKYHNDYSKIVLVETTEGSLTLGDFISWYKVRDQYVKLDDKSFGQYSRSLEQAVWRMVRDTLLCRRAEEKGCYGRPEVIKQCSWWMDKILYAAVKNEMIDSITLGSREMNQGKPDAAPQSELIESELTKKMFHKLNELKAEYHVTINSGLLGKLKVDDENDDKAIELYVVKQGGLIPRTPYPSIDNYWAAWQ